MKVTEQKIRLYNSIFVFAYLFAAGLILAVKGLGVRSAIALGLPFPFVAWCAWQNLRNDRLFVVYLLTFATILTPDIRLGGLPALRVEQGILFIIVVWFVVSLLTGKRVHLHMSLFMGMLVAFTGFIIFSTLVGSLVGFQAGFSDLYEIYKICIYLGIFAVVATVTETENDRWRILSFANLCIFFSGLVSLTQYFNPARLNEHYVPHIAPTQYTTLVGGYFSPRVVGLANNPNVYAVIAAIGAVLSIVLLIRTRKVWYLATGGINTLALLMTKSRTGLVFAVVVALALLLLYFADRVFIGRKIRLRPLMKMLLLLGIVAAVAPLIFMVLPEGLIWRFRDFGNFTSATSWQARMIHWQESIKYFILSPSFGVGAAKSVGFKLAPDNEWLLLLRKYGLLGTSWFVLMFITPFHVYRSVLKHSLLAKLYAAILIGLAVYMLPAAVFHSFQLMPLVMILGGIVFSVLPENVYGVGLRNEAVSRTTVK